MASTDFDNANDRTMAYYQPRADMPARDLRQLFDGIEYPGVQVQGPRFDSNNVLSTDVLEFFASNQTIKTTNLPAFNFTRQDLLPGQFFTLTGTEYNDGQWTIRTQKDNMITVVGANVGQFVRNESAGEMATISFFNQSNRWSMRESNIFKFFLFCLDVSDCRNKICIRANQDYGVILILNSPYN
jgi:hypothetical protein